MKKFKKLMVAGLATVMAVGVMSSFAACGGKTKLVVNTMFGGTDGHVPAFRQLNSNFLAAHDNVRIQDKSDNWAGTTWKDDFPASMKSKNDQPDVAFFFSGVPTRDFADKFVSVADIQKEYPDYGKNITQHDSDPNSLELKGTVQGMAYNTTKLTDDNVSTFDKLVAFFKANLTKGTDTIATSANAGYAARVDIPNYMFNVLMTRELGIKEFSAFDGTKAWFTDAKKTAWKKAFNKVINLMRDIGYNQPAAKTPAKGFEQNVVGFFKGNYGANVDGSWIASNIEASAVGADKIKVIPMPVNEGETSFVIGGVTSGWFITKQCWENKAKRDLAVDYVMTHSSDYAINLYCQTAGGIPANNTSVTGATDSAKQFTDLMSNEVVMAIDDRVPEVANGILFGDWSGGHPMAKLLSQEADPEQSETDALFDSFIAAL